LPKKYSSGIILHDRGEKLAKRSCNNIIRSIRPGYGLAPKFKKDIIGKGATECIVSGTETSCKLINE
jgi:sialic acid synthase SpsE